MIAQVLYNREGTPAAGSGIFTDVVAGQWYADAVNWAAANDIVGGYGNGKFGPEDDITREQMAQILYNYAAFKGYDVSTQGTLPRSTMEPRPLTGSVRHEVGRGNRPAPGLQWEPQSHRNRHSCGGGTNFHELLREHREVNIYQANQGVPVWGRLDFWLKTTLFIKSLQKSSYRSF